MSVAGISSSSFLDYGRQSIPNKIQQGRQDFQKLGQDLQSGNLSAAQSDFAALKQLGAGAPSTSSAQSSNSIVQSFNQLSQDLQSGNLAAAQKDYASIQQGAQTKSAQGHHHHHHGGGGSASAISQDFEQLGKALQAGNLATAQQAYSTMQNDLG